MAQPPQQQQQTKKAPPPPAPFLHNLIAGGIAGMMT